MADLHLQPSMMKGLLYPCAGLEIEGKTYEIFTDFRVWAEVERLIAEDSGDAGERFGRILALVYRKLPPHPIEALEKVFWFWSCGKDSKAEPDAQGDEKAVYSLDNDFPYIWASFLAQFGIDLSKTQMHWWHFRTLLECLDGDSCFSRIVGYRRVNLGEIKDREMRNFYMKMKKRYRLPQNSTEDCLETATADAFADAM